MRGEGSDILALIQFLQKNIIHASLLSDYIFSMNFKGRKTLLHHLQSHDCLDMMCMGEHINRSDVGDTILGSWGAGNMTYSFIILMIHDSSFPLPKQ